ncbi:hypothetical protein HPC38_04715 [Pasteurellaceae bacterium HPA106]|uniref:primosomal replication protein PriC n=1 Tax=Spirabiliibacterium pneumoniae TaxID=221400 RepID=UPI001AACB5E1|nr:primosomal replication protein PriC [Spirabiliibacterium pneumoniae]MBE2896176.1 hypothetical protein [Spirabiliibacterium pneumoniae]
MRKQKTTQLAQLAQAIAHFDPHHAKVLPAFFSPVLFPEDPHTVGEAQKIMQHTLHLLEQTHDGLIAQFYADKFTGQYHALNAILNAPRTTPLRPSTQHSQDIQQLPPRARLELYYGFLARLKNQLETQQNAKLEAQSAVSEAQINHTLARIGRCQAAIEQLEEYLAFVKRKEEGKSAV